MGLISVVFARVLFPYLHLFPSRLILQSLSHFHVLKCVSAHRGRLTDDRQRLTDVSRLCFTCHNKLSCQQTRTEEHVYRQNKNTFHQSVPFTLCPLSLFT